jgi:hypothetical protein
MKEHEIKEKLKEMKVGEPILFSTRDTDVYLEVDRAFVGIEVGWVIYHQGERLILRDLNEAVKYIAKYWNINLKKVMDDQFSELDEIVDLGEF